MKRTNRVHDGLFNCQTFRDDNDVVWYTGSFAILYICAYHYPSSLSSSLIYYFLVGPPIFRQC
jgi:hypothetical protein